MKKRNVLNLMSLGLLLIAGTTYLRNVPNKMKMQLHLTEHLLLQILLYLRNFMIPQ